VPYAGFHDPQSLNLYGYVRSLPTSKADFDGHQDCQTCTKTQPAPEPKPGEVDKAIEAQERAEAAKAAEEAATDVAKNTVKVAVEDVLADIFIVVVCRWPSKG
jgi:hypothetical protein